MHDKGISFQTHVENPELRCVCVVNASADNKAECVSTFLALADEVGLRLDPDMAYVTFSDHGGYWYARAIASVERPSLPLGPTTRPQHKNQTEAQDRDCKTHSRESIAALGAGSPVSDAIAAMRTGSPYIGGDRR